MTLQQGATFGVITATCNRLSLLKRALQSLEAQHYEHWVAVVVDDSTNSETHDWFAANPQDPRIIYVSNEGNRGVGFSRNRGLEILLPRVDFITKLDDDDYLRDTSLLSAAAAIAKHPGDQWFMSRHIDASSGRPTTSLREKRPTYNYWTDLAAGDVIAGDRTFFIATGVISAAGARFPEDIRLGGEWRFYAPMSEHAPIRFFEGGETWGEYLEDGLSSGQTGNLAFQKEELSDRLDFGRSLQLTGPDRVSAERNLLQAVFLLLVRHAKVGALKDGLSLLRKVDHRVALRSSESYRGAYALGAAVVGHRLASDKSSNLEKIVLSKGRRFLRKLNRKKQT